MADLVKPISSTLPGATMLPSDTLVAVRTPQNEPDATKRVFRPTQAALKEWLKGLSPTALDWEEGIEVPQATLVADQGELFLSRYDVPTTRLEPPGRDPNYYTMISSLGHWRGEWQAGVYYYAGDLVSRNGAFYAAVSGYSSSVFQSPDFFTPVGGSAPTAAQVLALVDTAASAAAGITVTLSGGQLVFTAAGSTPPPTDPGTPTVLAVPYAKVGNNLYADGELSSAFAVVRLQTNAPSISYKQTTSVYSENPAEAGVYVIDGTTPVGMQLSGSTGQETKSLSSLPGGTATRIITFLAPFQVRVNDVGERLGGTVDEITIPAGYTGTLLAPVNASTIIPVLGDSLSNGTGGTVPQRDGYARLLEAQYGWQLPLTGYGYRSWSRSLHTPELRTAELDRLARVPHSKLYVPLLTNDYQLGFGTPAGVAAIAGAFFDAYHAQFPGNTVYTHTMPQARADGEAVNGYTNADFNAPYAALLAGREAWLVMGDGPALYPKAQRLPDLVHYTAAGYAAIAANLHPFLGQGVLPTVLVPTSNFTPSNNVDNQWFVDADAHQAYTTHAGDYAEFAITPSTAVLSIRGVRGASVLTVMRLRLTGGGLDVTVDVDTEPSTLTPAAVEANVVLHTFTGLTPGTQYLVRCTHMGPTGDLINITGYSA